MVLEKHAEVVAVLGGLLGVHLADEVVPARDQKVPAADQEGTRLPAAVGPEDADLDPSGVIADQRVGDYGPFRLGVRGYHEVVRPGDVRDIRHDLVDHVLVEDVRDDADPWGRIRHLAHVPVWQH